MRKILATIAGIAVAAAIVFAASLSVPASATSQITTDPATYVRCVNAQPQDWQACAETFYRTYRAAHPHGDVTLYEDGSSKFGNDSTTAPAGTGATISTDPASYAACVNATPRKWETCAHHFQAVFYWQHPGAHAVLFEDGSTVFGNSAA